MKNRRRAASMRSPAEIAIDVLLRLGERQRKDLFKQVLNSSHMPVTFENQIYDIIDELYSPEVHDIVYDSNDNPTKFGEAIVKEVYAFIDGILGDALMYDRKELTERL